MVDIGDADDQVSTGCEARQQHIEGGQVVVHRLYLTLIAAVLDVDSSHTIEAGGQLVLSPGC